MVFRMRFNIKVLEINYTLRNTNLNISSWFVVHIFRYFYNKFFNERSYVVVRNYFCLPFLYTKNRFFYLDFHVFFYLDLASHTNSFSNFLSRKVRFLCWKDTTSTFMNVT